MLTSILNPGTISPHSFMRKLRLSGLTWFSQIHPDIKQRTLNGNPVLSDSNPCVLSAVSPCLGPISPWLTSSRTCLHILKFQTSLRTNFLKVNCPNHAVICFQGVNIGLQSSFLLPTSFLLLKIIWFDSLFRAHIPVRRYCAIYPWGQLTFPPPPPTLRCQVLSEIAMQALPQRWSFRSVAVTDKMSPWNCRDKAASLPAGLLSYLLWLSVFSLVVPDLLELFQFCKVFMGT